MVAMAVAIAVLVMVVMAMAMVVAVVGVEFHCAHLVRRVGVCLRFKQRGH